MGLARVDESHLEPSRPYPNGRNEKSYFFVVGVAFAFIPFFDLVWFFLCFMLFAVGVVDEVGGAA